MRLMRAALPFVVVSFVTFNSPAARADDANCPAGSRQKTEAGLTWCEPSVCEADANCGTGEVCRPVALCVEIGTMTGDAGQRLMVRQRCGADKSCPQTTTCSDMRRCVSRADAEKMVAQAPPAEPAKHSCGCEVPRKAGASLPYVSLAGLVVAVIGSRRGRPRK